MLDIACHSSNDSRVVHFMRETSSCSIDTSACFTSHNINRTSKLLFTELRARMMVITIVAIACCYDVYTETMLKNKPRINKQTKQIGNCIAIDMSIGLAQRKRGFTTTTTTTTPALKHTPNCDRACFGLSIYLCVFCTNIDYIESDIWWHCNQYANNEYCN